MLESGDQGRCGGVVEERRRTFFRIDDEWLGRSFSHQLRLKFFSTTFGERLRITGILPNASQGKLSNFVTDDAVNSIPWPDIEVQSTNLYTIPQISRLCSRILSCNLPTSPSIFWNRKSYIGVVGVSISSRHIISTFEGGMGHVAKNRTRENGYQIPSCIPSVRYA